jgi:signal transduction histidine kinase
MYTAYLLHLRERLARELLTKEKIESLSAMTGGLARDFQSLLSSISEGIDEAKASDLCEEARAHLLEAEGALSSARGRIQDLIAFSREVKPETQVTIVEDTLKEVCESETRGTGLSCHYDIPGDLWPGGIDRGMLRRALTSVVRHAVKNSPPSGTVFVSFRNLSVGVHSALPLARGDYIRMAVRDEGSGLSGEGLRKLFEPYAEGADKGLGLATACSIIQQNGGYVSTASDEGTGTAILVYVPVPAVGGPGGKTAAP